MIDFHNDIAILEAGIGGVAAAVDTVYKYAVWRVEEEVWIFEPVDGFAVNPQRSRISSLPSTLPLGCGVTVMVIFSLSLITSKLIS